MKAAHQTEVMDFMKQIDTNRKELNISITALCKTIGVPRSSYYQWLEGVPLGFGTAIELMKLVGAEGTGINIGPEQDIINPRRHKQLLEHREAAQYMTELRVQGMSISDISVAFMTEPKTVLNKITKYLTTSENEYRKKIK